MALGSFTDSDGAEGGVSEVGAGAAGLGVGACATTTGFGAIGFGTTGLVTEGLANDDEDGGATDLGADTGGETLSTGGNSDVMSSVCGFGPNSAGGVFVIVRGALLGTELTEPVVESIRGSGGVTSVAFSSNGPPKDVVATSCGAGIVRGCSGCGLI
jgi:hypothetical protein